MFSKMVILIPVYNPRERIINYVKKLKEKNVKVETGIFGAYMQVELINDGPITIMLEK